MVPPTLEAYTVTRSVIAQTADFLADRGAMGVEGTALWLGEPRSDTAAVISALHIPEQIAYRTSRGLAVEVTRAGLNALILGLAPGTFVLARVHSHGEQAYHSETDALNMIISHHGAISIVVPDLGRSGIDLSSCSVNLLRHGLGWREMSPFEVANCFEVVG